MELSDILRASAAYPAQVTRSTPALASFRKLPNASYNALPSEDERSRRISAPCPPLPVPLFECISVDMLLDLWGSSMFPPFDSSVCSPLPSSGSRGRPFRGPAVPHLHRYYGLVRLLVHPSPAVSGFPWRPPVPPIMRRRWRSSPRFLGNPFGNMPRARDSGDPGRLAIRSPECCLPRH